MRFWLDSKQCSHSNENACRVCDFDRYYANNYPDCPWRERQWTVECGSTSHGPYASIAEAEHFVSTTLPADSAYVIKSEVV